MKRDASCARRAPSRSARRTRGCALMPVPTAVPPCASASEARQQRPRGAAMPLATCVRPAAELLSEAHRHRVHQMRAAGLHDAVELLAPSPRSSPRRCASAGSSRCVTLERRADVDRRRDHVVAALAHVHVIVGDARACRGAGGELRDHLVGVHVRAGAGAGLEDVDGKCVVVLAGGDFERGRLDRARDVRPSSSPSSRVGCARPPT